MHHTIVYAEKRRLRANDALLTKAIACQEKCKHIRVLQYLGTQFAMRICQNCGLEEWASHWSGLTTDYWTRRDFKPGKLDNIDERYVRICDSNSFYACRIYGQPVPVYNR